MQLCCFKFQCLYLLFMPPPYLRRGREVAILSIVSSTLSSGSSKSSDSRVPLDSSCLPVSSWSISSSTFGCLVFGSALGWSIGPRCQFLRPLEPPPLPILLSIMSSSILSLSLRSIVYCFTGLSRPRSLRVALCVMRYSDATSG